ncbi:alpha/beta hydrolase [Microbacterium sp. ARD32]|uniref:alpha/beta hydrolase n=1 Tax=Microbacterium sp. ARD32 TaxID=2962577 RepID=UPI0028818A67|nr:alpha/beta hydrolase [Microbacterium sp. ARD32]MDT0156637.1 alpha/beta hydrolase [Microbacterium sp. ARD32]
MITIQIPAAIDYPERPDGDPSGAEALASTLLHGSASIAEFADEADRLSRPGAFWLGAASDAYAAHAQRFAKQHDPMGETLKRVARGIDVFAEQLRELQSEHTTLSGQVTAYERDRVALVADADAGTEEDAPALQDRARRLRTQRTSIIDDITGFRARTADNEDYLVRLFTGADTAAEARAPGGGVDGLAAIALLKRPLFATPKAMADWWNSLSEAEQNAVIAAYPEKIGSADGLPASARDRANCQLLESDLAELHQKEADGTLTAQERQRLKNAEATQKALKHADDYTVPGTDGEDHPGGQLWLYDPDAFGGDGRVAIAVGDLDTADDVSVQVPGIKTEMTDAPGGAAAATRLYESARYGGDGSSVATMFWLGYDTPDSAVDPATLTEGRAKDGGERLATAVDGLRASRPDSPAHMTAIGHSYGSTATSYAATDHDLAVDDIALIGSPGAGPADHASDFSVGAAHVYDGRNSRDAVAFFGDEGWARKDWIEGGLGVDPSSEDFGAQRFEAESVHRGDGRNFDDHSRYYDRDSESLYNLGRIVDGHGGDVNAASQSYDPWWRLAVDPEKDRTPTADVPGRSDTGTNIP